MLEESEWNAGVNMELMDQIVKCVFLTIIQDHGEELLKRMHMNVDHVSVMDGQEGVDTLKTYIPKLEMEVNA